MNTETGEIYRTAEEVRRAMALHGKDKIVPVSERVAKLIEDGLDMQADRQDHRSQPRPPAPEPVARERPRPRFKTRVKRSR